MKHEANSIQIDFKLKFSHTEDLRVKMIYQKKKRFTGKNGVKD